MTGIKIFILLFILVLIHTSCYNRFSCNSTNNLKLGNIEYSQDFQKWEVEKSSTSLIFSDSILAFELPKSDRSRPAFKKLNEYSVCKSIDIKSYVAYAYYDYENLESSFHNDTMLIVINPSIINEDSERKEVIYLNFAYSSSNPIKAQIPTYEGAKIGKPFGFHKTQFKLNKQITLNNKMYNDIWVCKKDGSGIYYSKDIGVVAIEMNNRIFLRI